MKLLSVNIGHKQPQQVGRKLEQTGIYKLPTPAAVRIAQLGIAEDFIGSVKHHGGPDQAIYVYGAEDYAWWSHELDRELGPGTFGDNLTISGLVSSEFNIGDYLQVGGVTLQATAPRIPCATLAARMGDPYFVKRFRRAERPGLYCRVVVEGFVQAGDEVRIERYQGNTFPAIEMFRDFYRKGKDEATLRHFLLAPIAIRARRDVENDLQALLARGS
jgi:MOSC domain-containing protein YiiM